MADGESRGNGYISALLTPGGASQTKVSLFPEMGFEGEQIALLWCRK